MPDWLEAARICREEAELWATYGRRNEANGHTDLARLDNAMSAACQNLERKFEALALKQERTIEQPELQKRLSDDTRDKLLVDIGSGLSALLKAAAAEDVNAHEREALLLMGRHMGTVVEAALEEMGL